MNILILSVGTRNKIVQYFRKELNGKGKVIATDNSDLAPALYEADQYYIVPKITDPMYLDLILDICVKENVKGVLSLIDPELEILSENKQLFLNKGITPIVSEIEAVRTSFSKYDMYLTLSKLGIPTIKTYITIEAFYSDFHNKLIDFPVFVKPNKGSASKGIGLVYNIEDLEFMFKNNNELIIQQYMKGFEYGADVYVDLIDNKPKALFLKKKLLMRAGETDKSVSVINKEINAMIFKVLDHLQFRGVIDIDIFEDSGKFYISEVNPRFGGGYPHAHETGINIPKMIINNLKGTNNIAKFHYESDIYMMKYSEVRIKI